MKTNAALVLLQEIEKRQEKNLLLNFPIEWNIIQKRFESNPSKFNALLAMEQTGGEPGVVDFDKSSGEYLFVDCSKESPEGRRSLCYDQQAWHSRKANKPAGSAMELATKMGISLLTEAQYRKYHALIPFDSKTSSWVLTPEPIRSLGGALFCDFRFGQVFTYHNGAESYYAARGFRGQLSI